jgi:acyl carrier protein
MPMSEDGLVESILDVLAEIRAVTVADLVSEVETAGMDTVTVSSHEVVAILVTLEPDTGIDPSDREVLKGCNLQSLQQLIKFVTAAAGISS